MATIWKKAATTVTEIEYAAIQDAAKKRGISTNAMLYALLKHITNNFKQWDCVPNELPRGYVVRKSNQI